MKKLTPFFFAILLPFQALASDCSNSGYTIVYVNGILTTQSEAEADLTNLKDKFEAITGRRDTTFYNGYNPSHFGGVDDWLSSIEQIYTQNKTSYVEDADLEVMLRQIQPEVTTRKLLLVGHSQGTFYTNVMYQYLRAHGVSQDALAVYNLGTPADYVGGNGKYLTSTNDRLVAKIRQLAQRFHAPEPLVANITIPLQTQPQGSYPGHSFAADYLGGAPDRVVSDMNTELGWLSARGPSDARSGCFDAPEIDSVTAARLSIYAVGDAAASGGVLALGTGIDLARQTGRNVLALANAAYDTGLALAEESAGAVSSTAAGLFNSVAGALERQDARTLVAASTLVRAPLISEAQLEEASAAAFASASSQTPLQRELAERPPRQQAAPAVVASRSQASSVSSASSPPSSAHGATALPPPSAAPASSPILALPYPFAGGSAGPASDEPQARTPSAPASASSTVASSTVASAADNSSAASTTDATTTNTASGATASTTDTTSSSAASTTAETASSTSAAASSTVPLIAPVLSILQCARSLSSSPDTCLIATTTATLRWSDAPGAALYAIQQDGGIIATTTATTTTLALSERVPAIFTVAALSESREASTSLPVSVEASLEPVAINEVGWAGTDASSSDQWIELRNETDTAIDLSAFVLSAGGADIALSGPLPATAAAPGFAILYRSHAIGGIDTPQLQLPFTLNANGEQVRLKTVDGTLIDETPAPDACAGWCGGTARDAERVAIPAQYDAAGGFLGIVRRANLAVRGLPPPETESHAVSMERTAPERDGGDSSLWQDNDGITIDGSDANGDPLYGTPGEENSVFHGGVSGGGIGGQ